MRFRPQPGVLLRASFDKWWLLPLGVLAASALVALGIVVFGPSFVGRTSAEIVAQRAISETTETTKEAPDCSGASAADYACHQKRYEDLVRGFGVEAAFAELKDEYKKNHFVTSTCHQLTHVIGRAAAELYGDLPATYGQGDDFCAGGYYHGAAEVVVAKIGPDEILDEANTLCADLSEGQKHSFSRRTCIHGLGHGFMYIWENELFESLQACDVLTDEQEKDECYDGVFMENILSQVNPGLPSLGHPSKYLKADQPFYPCTDVETRYKNRCYHWQAAYALWTQSKDFARTFDLCATAVEDVFRPSCYQGLGNQAAVLNTYQVATDETKHEATSTLCMLGEDHKAQSNCVIGAAKKFVAHHRSDKQAKAFCESLHAELRAVCLPAADEYYKDFRL